VLAEFSKIAQASSVGFFIMGFIGFFVKLLFLPVNNIILGAPFGRTDLSLSLSLYIFLFLFRPSPPAPLCRKAFF